MSESYVKVTSSPILGADNADVYGEMLGLSKDDVEALKKEGVV
jgi:crotonobetainyl-CoA:carnitine CoA-transferase CaiB-like acyl-CoA transferase